MSKRKAPLTRFERRKLYNAMRRQVTIGGPKGVRMTWMQQVRSAAIARRAG